MRRIRVPKERRKSFPNSGNISHFIIMRCSMKLFKSWMFVDLIWMFYYFVVREIGFRRNKSFGSILQCGCSHHWLIHSKSTNGYLVSSECEGKFWDETEHASFHGQPGCHISLEINSCHHLHWTYCNSLLYPKWIIWSTSSHGISLISRWNHYPIGL